MEATRCSRKSPRTACGGFPFGTATPFHELRRNPPHAVRGLFDENWEFCHVPRTAFTLLEVILAMSLTAVILGLVGMAIQVNLGVIDKSRRQVEEAQLARALLQRIADDLRNAVPFQATAPSGSGGSAAPSGSGATTSTGTGTSSTTSSTDTSGLSETSYSGGLYGSLQDVQVETSRRPRAERMANAPLADDSSPPARLSDIRTVTYSLGNPGDDDPLSHSGSGQAGLYRCEQDRAEFTFSKQQGQSDLSPQTVDLLAPEVVDLQITYYDGSTTADEWDSTQQGKLPSAVRVALSIRRQTAQSSMLGLLSSQDSPPGVYDMLIDLPNAPVGVSQDSSSGTLQTTGTSP